MLRCAPTRVMVLLLAASVGCAGAKPKSELEEPAAPSADGPPAPGSNEELGLAFANETEAPRAINGQAPAPLADPRKPFAEAMAAKSAEHAVALANALTGAERWKAHQLAFTQATDEPTRAAAALAWRQACGPESLEACRAAAMTALGRLKPYAKQATALHAADTCVVSAEAKQKPAPCFGTVERDDDVNQTRIALTRALAEIAEARRVSLLEKAVARCERPQCANARRKALNALTAIDLSGKKTESALAHALRENAIFASTLPEPERPWARSAKLEQLCAQYDTANGPGSCRKLEKQTNGAWSFKDFSAAKPQATTTAGLSADQVKVVNEHYSPPLQSCLSDQARRLVAPDQAQYEVRWVVFNDGRVGEVHLQANLEQSPLAACLRRQFSLWRYPRFEGEWQNVQQTFTVSAATRGQASAKF